MAESIASYRRFLWRTSWRLRAFAGKGPGYALANLRWRGRSLARSLLWPLARWERAGLDLPLSQEDLAKAASYRTRRDPAFHFDNPEVAGLVSPETRAKTIAAARDICDHTFRFRGVKAVMETVDWTYCPGGNVDWTRDLNRNFCFVTLGLAYRYTKEPVYASAFVRLARDWLAKNGPGSAAWSSPFEVAARLNAWIWAFFLFRKEEAFTDRDLSAFLRAFRQQARYLEANLEYHIPTNHLILEAKTLALCGTLFPEWEEAARWSDKGMSTLCAQLDSQVCTDGVHGERSILYHKIITSEVCELAWVLSRSGGDIPESLLLTLEKMLEFELYITRPDKAFPLFSDSALTDVLLRFSALPVGAIVLNRPTLTTKDADLTEHTIWLLGEDGLARYNSLAARTEPLESRGFPDGGYFVMRSQGQCSDYYMAVDCGPLGLPLVPDHGHADALSFELFAGDQPFIVDGGVYSYYLGEDWRSYFRGTRAHNTLAVDGRDQSTLDGLRHVYRVARASLHSWLPGNYFDWLDGSHDGYTRLPGPIVHRRLVLFVKGEYWLLADYALGEGSHQYDFLFHLTPSSNPVLEESALKTLSGRPTDLAILPLYPSEARVRIIEGERNPIQGWVSFESGEVLRSPAVDYVVEGSAPARLALALFPFASGKELPTVEGYSMGGAGKNAPMAGSLKFRAWTDYVILAPDAKGAGAAGLLQTDGRTAFLRWENGKGRLTRAFLVDGSHLTYQGIQVVRASGKADAVELSYNGVCLDVWANGQEDCELTVLVPGPVSVKVNGRISRYSREGAFISFPLATMVSDPREVRDEGR